MVTHTLRFGEIRSGIGLLFHKGLSLGVADYVVGSRPTETESAVMFVHAPYVDGDALKDETVVLHLDVGGMMVGCCRKSDSASWLLVEPHAIARQADSVH